MSTYITKHFAVLTFRSKTAQLFVGRMANGPSPDLHLVIFLPETEYQASQKSGSLWDDTMKQVAIHGSKLEIDKSVPGTVDLNGEPLNPEKHVLKPEDELIVDNPWKGDRKKAILRVK